MNKNIRLSGRLFLSLSFLFLSLRLMAQPPVWTKQIGGQGSESVIDFKVDNEQKAVMIGQFSDTLNFETNGGSHILTPNGTNSIYIQKRTVNGDLEWVKHIDSNGDYLDLSSIEIDAQNNIYVTGTFQGNFTIDFGNGVETINSNGYRSLILKVAENGDLLWVSTPFLPGNSMAYDIKLTNSNLLVVGRCNSLWNSSDLFMSKLDSSGNEIWTKIFGGGTWHEGAVQTVDVDNQNNIVISGYWRGTVNFNPSGLNSFTPEISKDVFTAKYSENGDFIWFKSIPTDIGAYTTNYEMVVDQITNDIYTSSSFRNSQDFDPGNNEYIMNASDFEPSIFIQKLDSNGDFVWAKTIGNEDFNLLSDLSLDSEGNIWLTGTFIGTVDFNPNSGTAPMTAIGLSDMFVQSLTSDGYFLWCAAYTGDPFLGEMELSFDQNGSCYLAGTYKGQSTIDPSFNSFALPESIGEKDIFISKMDATVDLVEIDKEQLVQFYPNPSSRYINLQGDIEVHKINIFNLHGQLITSIITENNIGDLRSLETGTYLIQFNDLLPMSKLILNK